MDAGQNTTLKGLLYSLIPEGGHSIGNITLRAEFKRVANDSRIKVSEDQYRDIRQALLNEGKIDTGRGRGGSVRRIMSGAHESTVVRPEPRIADSLPSANLPDDPSGNAAESEKLEEERIPSEIEGEDEESEAVLVDPNEEVSIEKADRSLHELHRWHQAGRLVLDPEWQRNYVWSDKQASKLVESFMMGIPVPVVYLAKTEDQKYEVIDGVQRLSSMFRFFANEFDLRGIDALGKFVGKKFSGLPEVMQNKLRDATLRTLELSPKTSKELLFVIFEPSALTRSYPVALG